VEKNKIDFNKKEERKKGEKSGRKTKFFAQAPPTFLKTRYLQVKLKIKESLKPV